MTDDAGVMSGPNPDRLGACPDCGSYRSDGRPPYLHRDGCARKDDLQVARFMQEAARSNWNGPVIAPHAEGSRA